MIYPIFGLEEKNMHIFHRPPQPPKWSASLCDCASDVGTCCITCWLPCITFGQIAEIVEEEQSCKNIVKPKVKTISSLKNVVSISLACVKHGCIYGLLMLCSCHCLLSCVYREKLRAKFGLPAEPCNDCCVHWCCEACALCQEHAELKNRGFDLSKGWNGPPNAPPSRMPPTMKR